MDPAQLRLITSLEKQITPFSADPSLPARPAISKLWKKQQERERQTSDGKAEPEVTSNTARISSLHGKKEWQGHNPQTPLTLSSVSFHKCVDFARHALRTVNINMDFSAETTKLLAQHVSGIHQSKSHSHFSIFRAELGLLMATAGITKPNDASVGTRLETYAGPVAEFYKRCSQSPGCKRKFCLGGMDWAKGMWNTTIPHFQDHYDCKGGGGRGKEKKKKKREHNP